jgi:zinc transport system permease protein
MLEFLFAPLMAGLLIALVAGPLGAFVVWRKMAYFGDTLAHGSLFGLALGFLFQVNMNIALVVSCVLLALMLVVIERKNAMSTDTLLGIIAHTSLSLGLVAISFLDNLRVDLMAYLFGDLLSVNMQDLWWIGGISVIVSIILAFSWRALLAITISEDMARVDGYPVDRLKLLLMLLIAIVVAIAMKFIGALIITSLMIIPAATARRFSKSPEQMACYASLIGIFAVFGGMSLSWYQDTPAGPSVVVVAALLFLLSQIKKQHN